MASQYVTEYGTGDQSALSTSISKRLPLTLRLVTRVLTLSLLIEKDTKMTGVSNCSHTCWSWYAHQMWRLGLDVYTRCGYPRSNSIFLHTMLMCKYNMHAVTRTLATNQSFYSYTKQSRWQSKLRLKIENFHETYIGSNLAEWEAWQWLHKTFKNYLGKHKCILVNTTQKNSQ